MKNILAKDMIVSASLTDTNCQLGVVPMLTVVQDNMCEFFQKIKCDGLSMVPKCNCFFVLTKTKIVFNKFLDWLDAFSISTEFFSIGKVRVNLVSQVYKEDCFVAECLQEMCALDATSRSIRTVETTALPDEIEASGNSELKFQKLAEDHNDSDFIKDIVVNLPHLDFYKHINNVEYARLMLSTISQSLYESILVKDFEIHYLSECIEGDVLSLYTRIEDCQIRFWIKRDGVVVCKAVLGFVNK